MGRIKFGVYKTPKGNGTEQQACARFISRGTQRMDELCEHLSETCTLTSADVKGVIEALTLYIGRNLSRGYSVELEGLGHFSPALKTVRKTDENGQSIFFARADGVNFRCSKRLKALVNKERPIKVKRENVTSNKQEDRKNKMLNYLKHHPHINLTDYAALNSCSRYRATEDMKKFVEEAVVIKIGYRTHRVYALPGKEEKG
ncbi:HU family DNA-binding protein [Parabacteroides johnsonii]|uniref:HU domain-containing protein n=1 Tax=Parabacteroides johnsonii CL02T12C29 TaxID=999419 RepID=K5Z343_9BACT|nr:HU family DNA-binding protein [Parabacteroides johnsonii]EKN05706.1 hypothetical protein HMPREF1077_03687 [Parabacteroides johnsonii CL02T12C29]